MLDELEVALVTAVIHACLARVDEPLGSCEVLVIPDADHADDLALCLSMGSSLRAE